MTKDNHHTSTTNAKVGPEEARLKFRNLHPLFDDCWHQAVREYEEDLARNMVYGDFAWALKDLLTQDPTIDLYPIMRFVEDLMRNGTQDVQDTVAVYFIEGLINAADENSDIMMPVFQMLGPVSREYALAWNNFNGTWTKGLEY